MRAPRAVLAVWVVVAGGLFLLAPPLEAVVAQSTTAFLPADSPTLHGLRVMDTAFGSGRTQSFVFVVLVNEHGLDRPDQGVYRSVVTALENDRDHVSEVQHYLGNARARRGLTSDDGRATYIAVGLPSAVGSPQSDRNVAWLRDIVQAQELPSGLQLFVTGDPAMLADMVAAVNKASLKVTVVSVVLLLAILWIIYRRLATIVVPLVTIGVALVTTRALIAIAGDQGMALSSYTDAFVIAITLGAGTDYCVFLISRFRAEYAEGRTPARALAIAVYRIGPALLASAATVVLAAISLAFTKLAIFTTSGPPMAICVAVTVAVSLTLTPALISLLGTRIGPAAPPSPTSRWARASQLVANRPARVLAVGTGVLTLIALALPTMRLSFDERAAQPEDTPSNLGLTALNEHFPANETLPDYLLLRSDHDLGNTRDLAVLNDLSISLAKVDGVAQVRSLTQPAGTPLKPASIANQLGRLAREFANADRDLSVSSSDVNALSKGTGQLGEGLDQVTDGSRRAGAAMRQLSNGNTQIANGLGKAVTKGADAQQGTKRLAEGAATLAVGLHTAHDQTAPAVAGIGAIADALSKDALCTVDPVCAQARKGLKEIHQGLATKLLPGLAQAATGADSIAQGTGRLADGFDQLIDGLRQARQGNLRIAQGQQVLAQKMGQLGDGTAQMSAAAASFAPDVDRLITQTTQLRDGLAHSQSYLRTVSKQADTPAARGFYLPATALDRPDFAQARNLFLSPDGKTARIQVTGATDPLTPDGRARYHELQSVAEHTLTGTRLEDAQILTTGAGGLGADLEHYLFQDARMVLIVVLALVFLILVLALRALVAPLYLLASVVLSFAAALGLTVLVFQHLFGQDIHFTVPVIVFVLLVAVGADYNILLMSRMRESGLMLTRDEVARAVTATGPVITAAGIIFASTFIALLASPVLALQQTGFAVATGLLVDTFIVRSLIVPSCAALLEERNWWPARPGEIPTSVGES